MLHSAKTKKDFLKSALIFLSLTAAIAIFSVLFGDFGEAEFKILTTTFTLSATCLGAMACAAFSEKLPSGTTLARTGIALCCISGLLLILGVWLEPKEDIFWKFTITLITLALSLTHALLLHIPQLDHTKKWLTKAASASIAMFGFLLICIIWGELVIDGLFRSICVLAIIVALFTLAIPITAKISRSQSTKDESLTLHRNSQGTWIGQDGHEYQVTRVAPQNHSNE